MSIHHDFDLQALYAALDEKRRASESSWNQVAHEINAQFREVPDHRPIATSTITRLKTAKISGAMPLQMLLWLDRTPESFVPEFGDAAAERFKLRGPTQNTSFASTQRGSTRRWMNSETLGE
jgi:hypothetical protein